MITSELMQVTVRKGKSANNLGGEILDSIMVLKCGGSSIDDLSDAFFENIKQLMEAGMKPVIVHGGGPAIQGMLEKLEISFEFVDGLRKTTEPMMEIVEMVLSGSVNPKLVRRVNESGINALGVSGTNMDVLRAEAIDYEKYGLVGEVTQVNTVLLEKLIGENIVPIISPIALGKDGKTYNINADTAAGAVASALGAEQLIFVTDVPGILQEGNLLTEVTVAEIEELITSGVIYGGMIPKVKAAMKGLLGKVKEVMIVNGKDSALSSDTRLVGTTISESV